MYWEANDGICIRASLSEIKEEREVGWQTHYLNPVTRELIIWMDHFPVIRMMLWTSTLYLTSPSTIYIHTYTHTVTYTITKYTQTHFAPTTSLHCSREHGLNEAKEYCISVQKCYCVCFVHEHVKKERWSETVRASGASVTERGSFFKHDSSRVIHHSQTDRPFTKRQWDCF